LILRLNSRCLLILKLLAASEQPLAAVNIAKQLNISARMVRSSLAYAEGWLRDQHVDLLKVPGKGFSLPVSNETRKKLVRVLQEYDDPLPWLSATERKQVLLITLFYSEIPLQIKQLQQTVNLSRTTVLHLLESIEPWLREYDLELVRRPNYGFKINGDEVNWRKAVHTLLQESAGDAQLLALFTGARSVVDLSCLVRTALEDTLQKVWIRLDLPTIRLIISPIEHVFKEARSDQAFIIFFLYLAVVIHRNRSGKDVGKLPDPSRYQYSPQRLAEAMKIGAKVLELMGIRLSDAEISWLALQIQETGLMFGASLHSTEYGAKKTDISLKNTIDQFLTQASLSLHPSLPVDEDLVQNLAHLLEKMRNPGQWGQAAKNPLLREVKNQYPYFYSVARQGCPGLSEWIGRELSDDVIGDIAICLIASMERMRLLDRLTKKILVVCSAGVVTAWLLVSRLRAEFSNIVVVDVISVLELENRDHFEGIDFIVSTVPIRIKDIPSRQVNPLLGAEDIKRLKDLFENNGNRVSGSKQNLITDVHLSDLIIPVTIQLGIEAENWESVVEKAGSRLLDSGAIEPQFIQAMKKIIQEFGPYMVIWPGTVLLHAPPQGVRRLCMGLITLKKPVPFGHPKNDPVKLAIVLAAMDNRSHITALLELNELMRDGNAVASIKNTLHKSVILHWVRWYSTRTNLSQSIITK